MCATCGCSDDAGVRVSERLDATGHGNGNGNGHGHGHGHGHDHGHEHAHGSGVEWTVSGAEAESAASRTITLEQDVLAKNDQLAQLNRAWLAEREVLALNMMSSPGAGKTTLLERTLRECGARTPVSVIEGDQETWLDADRLRSTGWPIVQINTGSGCHLDAQMLAQGLRSLNPDRGSVVFIENVGNLVCPALFDLGEHAKVVIASVTDGEDKPLKYPNMFRCADLVLLNKADLLSYLDYDMELFIRNAEAVNPGVRVRAVSAISGDGLESWYAWLDSTRNTSR